MVRRYSKDVKDLALSMSLQGLRDSEIHEITGISVRSLKRFRKTHRQTGGVPSPPPIDNGRPRMLSAIQVKLLDLLLVLIEPVLLLDPAHLPSLIETPKGVQAADGGVQHATEYLLRLARTFARFPALSRAFARFLSAAFPRGPPLSRAL
ncbi:hypothetical protein EDB85DRAFT_2152985 [Lactarius pseudohatsudake]|nr:hypothetical protein EDB85DRAFT_2152985 [Lactarius pseudohatsudake]